MSISPTHWMPIRGPRYADIRSTGDSPSRQWPPDDAVAEPPRESHRPRRTSQHHRRSRSRSSREDPANSSNHHHRHAHRSNRAPASALRKVAPPPPPPRTLPPQSQHEEAEVVHMGHPSPTLQPQWDQPHHYGGNDDDDYGLHLDSTSASRSSSVSSCLSSSAWSSADSSVAPIDFIETHGNTPHVRTQTHRSTSEVLAELAIKGSGVALEEGGDDAWTRGGAEDAAERPHTPTVSGVSPFPPPPPPLPPASALLPMSATTGDEAIACTAPSSRNGGVSAKKSQPRVATNIPPPCPALFQHMEGSPHGIQMLSAQSPRVARRKDSQPQPQLASPPEDNDSRRIGCGDSGPLCCEGNTKSEGSGAVLQSPAGSSNGLSGRTTGATPLLPLVSSATSPLSPTEAAATATTPERFYKAAPTFSAEAQSSAPQDGPSASRHPTRSTQLRSPLTAARGGGGGGSTAHVRMATPDSSRDALSLPPSPALCSVRAPPPAPPSFSSLARSRFSVQGDSGSGSSASTAALKVRPPSLNLTSPRPFSGRRLSSSFMSPLTDYHPSEGSVLLSSLPATPLAPRNGSGSATTPLVPPLDFTGISDGPLVRDGAASDGSRWRSTDDASGMLTPGAAIGSASNAHSGYDEDDDESEDEFADYRPRWRKEEELRLLEEQQQQRHTKQRRLRSQRRSAGDNAGGGGSSSNSSSSDDYIVPGYNDAAGGGASFAGFNLNARHSTRASRHPYPSRAAAAYASRAGREASSHSFWRGGGSHRTSKVGSSSTSWMESIKRFLSVAGTWLTRILAIYISSLLILKTRSMM